MIDPDAVQFTSESNGDIGLNRRHLRAEDLGAVQVIGGTQTWQMPLPGTSMSLCRFGCRYI